jgi:hypothetical protein
MIPSFPQEELKLIDMTIKMFTEPVLYVEQSTLQERLTELQEEKFNLQQLLDSCFDQLIGL